MPWTVVWIRKAHDELATLWLVPETRRAITSAADRIDKALRTNPERSGEDYFGDLLIVERPLSVVYSIDENDRLVRVLQV